MRRRTFGYGRTCCQKHTRSLTDDSLRPVAWPKGLLDPSLPWSSHASLEKTTSRGDKNRFSTVFSESCKNGHLHHSLPLPFCVRASPSGSGYIGTSSHTFLPGSSFFVSFVTFRLDWNSSSAFPFVPRGRKGPFPGLRISHFFGCSPQPHFFFFFGELFDTGKIALSRHNSLFTKKQAKIVFARPLGPFLSFLFLSLKWAKELLTTVVLRFWSCSQTV